MILDFLFKEDNFVKDGVWDAPTETSRKPILYLSNEAQLTILWSGGIWRSRPFSQVYPTMVTPKFSILFLLSLNTSGKAIIRFESVVKAVPVESTSVDIGFNIEAILWKWANSIARF